MKANTSVRLLVRSLGTLALCCPLLVGAVFAQDDQSDAARDADRERLTIIIDPDGNVTINGEEVESGDSSVLRFDRGGRDIVVVRPEAGAVFHADPLMHFRLNGDRSYEGVFDEFGRIADQVRFELPSLEEFGPLMGDAAFIARESAETRELEREAHELARRARRAEGAERQRLEEELREKLHDALQAKLETRGRRVEQLEQRLQEERETLETRRRAQDEIVNRRMRELLGEGDVLDW